MFSNITAKLYVKKCGIIFRYISPNSANTILTPFSLISLAAKSFYDLEIQYAMDITEYTPDPENVDSYFEINSTTGDLIALKQLDYTLDPHRYVVSVTATEEVSGFSTTQQVRPSSFNSKQ